MLYQNLLSSFFPRIRIILFCSLVLATKPPVRIEFHAGPSPTAAMATLVIDVSTFICQNLALFFFPFFFTFYYFQVSAAALHDEDYDDYDP